MFTACLFLISSLLPWLPLSSLFQGWWLWLESLHRWQASLPSGEGLHSLNFLHFSLFFFFALLQLKVLACYFRCLASLYLAAADGKGPGRLLKSNYLHRLSGCEINGGYRYQQKAQAEVHQCQLLGAMQQLFRSPNTWQLSLFKRKQHHLLERLMNRSWRYIFSHPINQQLDGMRSVIKGPTVNKNPLNQCLPVMTLW